MLLRMGNEQWQGQVYVESARVSGDSRAGSMGQRRSESAMVESDMRMDSVISSVVGKSIL